MTMTTSDTCIVSGDMRLIDEGKLQFIHLKDQDDKIQEGEKNCYIRSERQNF